MHLLALSIPWPREVEAKTGLLGGGHFLTILKMPLTFGEKSFLVEEYSSQYPLLILDTKLQRGIGSQYPLLILDTKIQRGIGSQYPLLILDTKIQRGIGSQYPLLILDTKRYKDT